MSIPKFTIETDLAASRRMVTVVFLTDRHPRHPHGTRAEAGEHPEADEGHRRREITRHRRGPQTEGSREASGACALRDPARFIDQEIRERVRDEQIDSQLAGINERLRERSKVDRAMHHGKMVTAEELAAKLDAMERAKGEDIAKLRGEVDRLRSELEAARATASALDHRRMPPPRKSWRTTVAENVTAAPLD
jgi:hypothetical protein